MQTEFPPTSAQNSLGQCLRSQRLAKQMSIEDVVVQLKLPTTIVEAMERDDHSMLGATIFARGRLGNYARLVGVPAALVDAQFADAMTVPPPLVSTASSSRLERNVRRFARQSIYIVLTATIVLPVVWLATQHQLPQAAASLTALDSSPVPAQNSTVAMGHGANAAAGEARSASPVVASIAPFGSYGWASPSAANPTGQMTANTALQLRFSGDSWVDIVGVDGRVIEHGAVEAGSVRNYQTVAVARVAIGNPGSVLVLRNGEPLDLKPFQGANQTRFTLSSDGKPAPVRD